MENLCINGEVISSNDFQIGYPDRTKENAFDGDRNTMWGSLAYPADTKSWIGYNFLKPVIIQEISLVQSSLGGSINKVLLQGFNNEWVDIQSFNLLTGDNKLIIDNDIYFSSYRLMALSNAYTLGWAWGVNEIEMLGNKYKYLIKQGPQYYTIKPEFYTYQWYRPLNLLGVVKPNKSDFLEYGFNNIIELCIETTIGSETFRPIDKFDNGFKLIKILN